MAALICFEALVFVFTLVTGKGIEIQVSQRYLGSLTTLLLLRRWTIVFRLG